jgi:hypothetical protein
MGSAIILPERIDSEFCKQLAGERFNKEVFDAYKDSKGTISREKLLELNHKYECRNEAKDSGGDLPNWNCWEIDEQEMRPMGSVSVNWSEEGYSQKSQSKSAKLDSQKR